MPKLTSFGDFQPIEDPVPCWEIVQKDKFFSSGAPLLRKGDQVLRVTKDGFSRFSAAHPNWAASVERTAHHSSVHVSFSVGQLAAQFYVLIGLGGDLTVSHPEIAEVQRAINGIQLRMTGVGTARRREYWKDSDTARNVVGFIDILDIDNSTAEPLLAWLCFLIGTMIWVDGGD